MKNNFSNNLKFLRLTKGITQEDLGKKLDKDYSTIGKWENGTRSPVMEDAIKVSEIFDVPLEKLLLTDLRFDNAEVYDINDEIQIPVYGTIQAGIQIES